MTDEFEIKPGKNRTKDFFTLVEKENKKLNKKTKKVSTDEHSSSSSDGNADSLQDLCNGVQQDIHDLKYSIKNLEHESRFSFLTSNFSQQCDIIQETINKIETDIRIFSKYCKRGKGLSITSKNHRDGMVASVKNRFKEQQNKFNKIRETQKQKKWKKKRKLFKTDEPQLKKRKNRKKKPRTFAEIMAAQSKAAEEASPTDMSPENLDPCPFEKQAFASSYDDMNVNKITSELSNITGMMTTMTQHMHQQGQTITRIVTNVGDASDHVDVASKLLMEYLQTVRTNRPLMIKSFIMLIICMFTFLYFIT